MHFILSAAWITFSPLLEKIKDKKTFIYTFKAFGKNKKLNTFCGKKMGALINEMDAYIQYNETEIWIESIQNTPAFIARAHCQLPDVSSNVT